MKSTLFWVFLTVLLAFVLVGCTGEEAADPAVVGEETSESPPEGSGTTPPEGTETNTPPAETEEGSGTDEGSETDEGDKGGKKKD